MSHLRKITVASSMFSFFMAVLILSPASVAAQQVAADLTYQHDGDKTTITTFKNTRGLRFCEIYFILVKGEELEVNVYNPMGLNNMEATNNVCPDELLQKIDLEGLKTQYKLDDVYLNKPRFWLIDRIKMSVGAVRDFNGMDFHWMASNLISSDLKIEPGFLTYKHAPVKRDMEITYQKGKPVFLLDDPEGKVWIMKAFRDSNGQTYETLKELSSRYKSLPAGWTFRVETLKQDLDIHRVTGTAKVMQDEFENTFDYLGDGSSNYVP